MANIRKCAARFLIAAALFLGILCGVLFSGIAANAESMDKLRTDFREGSDGWEMNQLAVVSSSQGLQLLPGGRAETSDTMDGALLFIEFGSVGSGFTLELGVTDDGAALSPFDRWTHPALGTGMYVTGMGRNLMEGTAQLKLKQTQQ